MNHVLMLFNDLKDLMKISSLPLIALVNNAGLAEYGPLEYYKMENIIK